MTSNLGLVQLIVLLILSWFIHVAVLNWQLNQSLMVGNDLTLSGGWWWQLGSCVSSSLVQPSSRGSSVKEVGLSVPGLFEPSACVTFANV